MRFDRQEQGDPSPAGRQILSAQAHLTQHRRRRLSGNEQTNDRKNPNIRTICEISRNPAIICRMSDPALPPRLPPIAQPIPVQSIPADQFPQQEEPTAYPHSYVRRRPGIITAVAILSITIGSLGMITSGLSALYGSLFFFVARQTAAFANMTPPATVTAPQPVVSTGDSPVQAAVDDNGEPVVADRGLDASRRKIIVDVFASQRPLSDLRRRQLHALLANAGQDMFLSSGGAIDAAVIRQAISQSGELPPASAADTAAGPDYFVVPTGRIEISDDRAVFEPADHSQETIRVCAPSPATSAAAATAGAAVISPQDVQTAVQIVNLQSGNRLTSPQRQTLATEFSSSTGLLRPPPPGTAIGSELSSTLYQPDGTVLVLTARGELQIAPDGSVRFRYLQSGTMTGQTGAFTATAFATGGTRPPIRAIAAIFVLAEAVLSLLLSIYLLLIGILALRQNPRGRMLHMIYAFLKIPLAILCGIAWCSLAGGLFAALPGNQPANASYGVRAFLLIMMTGMAVLYPIGLIITFSTPFVKRYYDAAIK
jgi:hypothetical protein